MEALRAALAKVEALPEEIEQWMTSKNAPPQLIEDAKALVDASATGITDLADTAIGVARMELPAYLLPFWPMIQAYIEGELSKEKDALDAKLTAWEAAKAATQPQPASPEG